MAASSILSSSLWGPRTKAQNVLWRAPTLLQNISSPGWAPSQALLCPKTQLDKRRSRSVCIWACLREGGAWVTSIAHAAWEILFSRGEGWGVGTFWAYKKPLACLCCSASIGRIEDPLPKQQTAGWPGHFLSGVFEPAEGDGGTEPTSHCPGRWGSTGISERQWAPKHSFRKKQNQKNQGDLLTAQLFLGITASLTWLQKACRCLIPSAAHSPDTEAANRNLRAQTICSCVENTNFLWLIITLKLFFFFRNENFSPFLTRFLYCTVKYETWF